MHAPSGRSCGGSWTPALQGLGSVTFPAGHVQLSTDGGTTFTDITTEVNPSQIPGLLSTVTIDEASGTVYLTGELTFKSTDRPGNRRGNIF